ncbi:unnamed protein product, partial [Allacma fusca]
MRNRFRTVSSEVFQQVLNLML